jgi:hypothetical protein
VAADRGRAHRSRTSPAGQPDEDRGLGSARGERWLPEQPVSSLAEAGRYVQGLGFALLFPAPQIRAPSLWEAVAGPDLVPFADGMGPAESDVWSWKDELPRAGLAWYGPYLYRRGSLLAPRLLQALYPGVGEPTDHERLDLPEEAHRVCTALLTGPLSTAALREIVGDRRRYVRAMGALHRNLLVTSAGVQQQRAGWPAGLVELTCRLFEVGGGLDHPYAARCFVDTMIEAGAAELSRAFGWTVAQARTHLMVGRD